ncbi:MAG: DUF3429 domain-containing protein [Chromatiales bacterium]|jgi:hypothetical protein
MIDSKQYAVLAYAGTLPFIACAILPWIGMPVVAGIGSCAYIAAAYGVAIVSFMAGIHWGTFLYQADSLPVNLLLTSNAITVAVWLAFILTPVAVSIAVIAAAFVLLLAVDFRLARVGLLTPDYLRTRRNVTLIVLAMLMLTIGSP